MKKLIVSILMCLPVMAMAQNSWEEKTSSPDSKYLVGAVTLENNIVTWRQTIDAPGKTKQEIYQRVKEWMEATAKEENQTEQSRVGGDEGRGTVIGRYQEWLVFKKTALVTDMTKFLYSLSVVCQDGKAEVKMTNLRYIYEEDRESGFSERAEMVITDEYGLKKNKQKLSRVYGRFRAKTIDRKDYLFSKLKEVITK